MKVVAYTDDEVTDRQYQRNFEGSPEQNELLGAGCKN